MTIEGTLRARECPAKKNFGAFFGEMNFINKSCRGKPSGCFGTIIMSLSDNFTNEIIALNFIKNSCLHVKSLIPLQVKFVTPCGPVWRGYIIITTILDVTQI